MGRISSRTSVALAVAGLAFAVFAATAAAKSYDNKMIAEADRAISAFEKADPGMKAFLSNAAGYVVFPGIDTGSMGTGAHGNGVVYEGGKPVGTAGLNGAQAGGQKFAELIAFERAQDLARFKEGQFAFSGDVNAFAVKSGVSTSTKFEKGVAVFTQGGGKGLMDEASVSGQTFSYQSFGAR